MYSLYTHIVHIPHTRRNICIVNVLRTHYAAIAINMVQGQEEKNNHK